MNYYKNGEPYAPNIIDDLARYLPRCGVCKRPATVKYLGLVIIGDPPLRCDDCSGPTGLKKQDIIEAPLARACDDFLRKNAIF